MKRTIFTLLALAIIANFAFGGYGKPLTIDKTTKAVKIDGKMTADEPWTTTWIKMTAAKPANTTTGMSAQFQLAYDDANLYILCQQAGNASEDTDATLIPNSYERDCFEVFVKMDTSTTEDTKYPTDGCYQYRQQRGSVYPDRFDDPKGGRFKGYKDFKIAQDDGAAGFTQEWQLPWISLTDSNKLADTSGGVWTYNMIKFEIQGADNTTGKASGRTQQMFWQDGSDNQWDNVATFSLVSLKTAVKPIVIQNAVKNVSVNNTVIVNTLVADVLKLSTTVKNVTIYNITGKEVLNLKNVNSVNMAKFSSGIYFVRANNVTTKIVKR